MPKLKMRAAAGKIMLVVPAFNEAANLESLCARIREALSPLGREYSIFMVDDGSRDDTAQVAARLARDHPIRTLRHERNRGLAAVFLTGMRAALADGTDDDVVVVVEGDGTSDPAALPAMLQAMDGRCDVVIASRYAPGGCYRNFPPKRLALSLAANALLRWACRLPGVRDYTIFYRAYRAGPLRRAVEAWGDRFTSVGGFACNAEMLLRMQGLLREVREVPLVYDYALKKGASAMRILPNLASYLGLFRVLLSKGTGASARLSPWPALIALLAVALGLIGIGWGLPSRDRLQFLLPPGSVDDPALHRLLASSHRELYAELERHNRGATDDIQEAIFVRKGWAQPPRELLNSYRSYFLRSANPDEQKNLVYLAHMNPRRLEFEPYGVSYGGAYIYPLGAYYAALGLARLIPITSSLEPYLGDVSRMRKMFLAGRVFSLSCLAGCLLVLYGLGRRLGGAAVGSAAAILFMASPAYVLVSHTLNPYGWGTLWFLLACSWVQRYLEGAGRRCRLLAAAAVGMSVGSSPAYWTTAALLAAPLLRRDRRWPEAAYEVLEMAAAAGVVYVATNPYLFLRFDRFADEMVYMMVAFPFRPSLSGAWGFLTDFLMPNWGVLLTVACLCGVARWALRKGRSSFELLLSLAFAAAAVDLAGRGMADFSHGRHFLPFFALGCLAAAGFLQGTLARRSRAGALGLLALLALDSFSVGASYLWNFREEARHGGTRMQAARWLAERLPAGASLGFAAWPQPSSLPPIRFDRHDIVLFSDPVQLAGRPLPQYVVASEEQLAGPRIKAFLEENYSAAASFLPPRLLPWVEVRGLYSMANPIFVVYRRGS